MHRAARRLPGAVFGAGADEFKRIFNASFVTVTLVGCGCYRRQVRAVARILRPVPRARPGAAARRSRRSCGASCRTPAAPAAWFTTCSSSGPGSTSTEVRDVLERESWLGYHVVGSLVPDAPRPLPTAGLVESQPERVAAMARAVDADVVFLAGGAFDSATDMRRLAWQLEHEDIQVVIAPSVTDVSRERISVRPVGGLPLIHLEKPRSEASLRWAKRTFDVVGSFTLLMLFAPVMLWAALWVRLHDGGPDPVPADPGRSRGQDLPDAEAPHHGHRRRRPAGSPSTRTGSSRAASSRWRTTLGSPARTRAPPVLPRRAAAALQRPARRHEPGRARGPRWRTRPRSTTTTWRAASGCVPG